MLERESLEELKIGIADIVFSLVTETPSPELIIDRVYKQFITDGRPDISLRVYYGTIPNYGPEEKIFDSGGTWSLCRHREGYILRDCSLEPGSLPEMLIILKSDFESGEIYIDSSDSNQNSSPYVLSYPLDQILMINLLSLERGVLLHACGVDDGGCGYLFLGNSTHGKSTTAKIWSEASATVLNDDRIVVREKAAGFWMYGTPWHGDYPEVSTQGLPIHKMFFLHPGGNNLAVPKNEREALSMALTRCFPPIWNKKGMEYTVDFCHRLVEKVPCYGLDFVPDKTVVEFVRDLQ